MNDTYYKLADGYIKLVWRESGNFSSLWENDIDNVIAAVTQAASEIIPRRWSATLCVEEEEINADMLEALEAVEWEVNAYFGDEWEGAPRYCPWCGGNNDYPFDKEPEHTENCIRQKAIAKAKGE